jgi:hypothetical protein
VNWNTKPFGFVRLEHLTLACSVSAAVLIRHAHGCQITGCTVRNTGGHGISASRGATTVSPAATFMTRAHGDLLVRRLPFAACGVLPRQRTCDREQLHPPCRPQGPRVQRHFGQRGRVSASPIQPDPRFSRTGIHTRGNRNRIEYNHIRHVNIETSDAAANNLCDRDLTQHDTKIRFKLDPRCPGPAPGR